MRRLLSLIFILTLAFALRVHLLGNQELRGDEGFSWNYIQDSPAEILARIVREGDPQPPIHYWLLWGWAKLTGDTEFAMRAWSALTSLLLVPLVYQVGRKLWRGEIGLIAAAITAIHPQQIWLAQDVRNMYQLALIALLIGTLILGKTFGVLKTPKVWGAWLAYVACGVFAMYSHYYALFFLIAHGGYVFANPGGRKGLGDHKGRPYDIWQWIAAGLAIAALVAPWAIMILPVYLHGQLADPGSIDFLSYTVSVFGDLAAGPAFPDNTKLIITLAFGLLTIIPVLNTLLSPAPLLPRSPSPRLLVYLASAILIPLIGIYAIVVIRSTFNSFYFVFAFPAAYLLAAGGIFALYKRFKPLGLSIALLTLITFSISLYNHYFDPQYSKTRGMRDVAARLAQAARPGDIYLANFPDPVQVYYLRHLNLEWHMLPDSLDFDPDKVDAALGKLIAGRVWFVPINAIQLDPNAYVQSRLLDTAILAEDDRFNKMRLMLFLPPTAARPLDAQFEDGIALVGWYLTPNRLTLVWRADSTPSADYTVFVHALAPDGYSVNSHDAPPTHPTASWRPGQWIVDVHEFEIPSNQPISLVAGLYLPSTGERVRIKSAASGEPNAALVTAISP